MAGIDDSLTFYPLRIAVLTVSDTRTEETDKSGALLVERLTAAGHELAGKAIVHDEVEAIRRQVRAFVDDGAVDVILATGGTGFAPRDVTPEAVQPLLDRELPGVLEAVRAAGRVQVPTAALSRGVAGIMGSSFVVTLPGSVGGARDGAAVLQQLAQHVIDQLAGHDH
jgi:molybdenum cofactor biosynthesis protein B